MKNLQPILFHLYNSFLIHQVENISSSVIFSIKTIDTLLRLGSKKLSITVITFGNVIGDPSPYPGLDRCRFTSLGKGKYLSLLY